MRDDMQTLLVLGENGPPALARPGGTTQEEQRCPQEYRTTGMVRGIAGGDSGIGGTQTTLGIHSRRSDHKDQVPAPPPFRNCDPFWVSSTITGSSSTISRTARVHSLFCCLQQPPLNGVRIKNAGSCYSGRGAQDPSPLRIARAQPREEPMKCRLLQMRACQRDGVRLTASAFPLTCPVWGWGFCPGSRRPRARDGLRTH